MPFVYAPLYRSLRFAGEVVADKAGFEPQSGNHSQSGSAELTTLVAFMRQNGGVWPDDGSSSLLTGRSPYSQLVSAGSSNRRANHEVERPDPSAEQGSWPTQSQVIAQAIYDLWRAIPWTDTAAQIVFGILIGSAAAGLYPLWAALAAGTLTPMVASLLAAGIAGYLTADRLATAVTKLSDGIAKALNAGGNLKAIDGARNLIREGCVAAVGLRRSPRKKNNAEGEAATQLDQLSATGTRESNVLDMATTAEGFRFLKPSERDGRVSLQAPSSAVMDQLRQKLPWFTSGGLFLTDRFEGIRLPNSPNGDILKIMGGSPEPELSPNLPSVLADRDVIEPSPKFYESVAKLRDRWKRLNPAARLRAYRLLLESELALHGIDQFKVDLLPPEAGELIIGDLSTILLPHSSVGDHVDWGRQCFEFGELICRLVHQFDMTVVAVHDPELRHLVDGSSDQVIQAAERAGLGSVVTSAAQVQRLMERRRVASLAQDLLPKLDNQRQNPDPTGAVRRSLNHTLLDINDQFQAVQPEITASQFEAGHRAEARFYAVTHQHVPAVQPRQHGQFILSNDYFSGADWLRFEWPELNEQQRFHRLVALITRELTRYGVPLPKLEDADYNRVLVTKWTGTLARALLSDPSTSDRNWPHVLAALAALGQHFYHAYLMTHYFVQYGRGVPGADASSLPVPQHIIDTAKLGRRDMTPEDLAVAARLALAFPVEQIATTNLQLADQKKAQAASNGEWLDAEFHYSDAALAHDKIFTSREAQRLVGSVLQRFRDWEAAKPDSH